jgi:histidine triad (HIT) family protein
MSECIFCDIIEGKSPSHKIWENDDFFAFLTIRPVNEGHTLLIPKKHVDYVFDMEETLYAKIFKAAKELSKPLKEAFAAPRIGLVIEGFYIPHVHLHLVPVYNMAELDPNRGKRMDFGDLLPIAEKIRKYL